MAECPRCEARLANPKLCTSCGWKSRVKAEKASEVREHVPCAHQGCGYGAIARVKTPTGWANFCEPHYTAYYGRDARANFTALGLDRRPDETRDQQHARVMGYIKANMKPKRFEDATMVEDEWSRTA